jgi:hypothetical protein
MPLLSKQTERIVHHFRKINSLSKGPESFTKPVDNRIDIFVIQMTMQEYFEMFDVNWCDNLEKGQMVVDGVQGNAIQFFINGRSGKTTGRKSRGTGGEARDFIRLPK